MTLPKFVLLCALILTPLLGIAHAQESLTEAITSFDSRIVVNVDNSIDVTETIAYTTGQQSRHWIFRDIYPYSSQGRKMSIEDVSVTDPNEQPYTHAVSGSNPVVIRIGDPTVSFQGQKTYVIHYHATNAVAQLQSIDELYWNVTGNEWGMPIYAAHASVELPSNATVAQSACYYGPKSSTTECPVASASRGVSFDAPSQLTAGEGLTVAVGFPKGIVTAYSASGDFFERYGNWIIAILLPLLTLILSLWYWYKRGRDARGTGVIYPQYEVPDALAPMEVGGIMDEEVTAKSISAEIIFLATKGYLKIAQLEEKTLGIFASHDYELTKLMDAPDILDEFDRKLLEALFFKYPQSSAFSDVAKLFSREPFLLTATGESTKLSDLKNVFYKEVPSIISLAANALLQKGYYKNLGRMKQSITRIHISIFTLLPIALLSGALLSARFAQGSLLPLLVGILLSVVIYLVIYRFSPAKTEKGLLAKENILGLKLYLQIAEKDRLLFHNAPDKKPEVFEKFLPYAMVLGVADVWAKEFEGIYTTPPSWYSGNTGAFSAVAFSHSMNSFSTYASSSLTSAPSGSGSGGGGFSGGGGGGGGGGGW